MTLLLFSPINAMQTERTSCKNSNKQSTKLIDWLN